MAHSRSHKQRRRSSVRRATRRPSAPKRRRKVQRVRRTRPKVRTKRTRRVATQKNVRRPKRVRTRRKVHRRSTVSRKPLRRSQRKVVRTKATRSKKPRIAKIAAASHATSGGVKYLLNDEFEFFPELRMLVLKSSPAEQDKMTKKINALGRVKLAIISGIFMPGADSVFKANNAVADLFLVGDDISKRKLNLFLHELEADVGKEIKFGIMDKEEFQYRYGMFDRFVRVLLEGPHEKIINKLGI